MITTRAALAMVTAAWLAVASSHAGEERQPPAANVFRFHGGEQVSISVPMATTEEKTPQAATTPGFGAQLVSPDGFVSVPELGLINILNKTLEEAAALIGEKLKTRTGIKDPRVAIALLSIPIPSRHVYILGEVKNPAPLELPVNHSLALAAALSAAGGPTETADLAHIRLVRGDQASTRREDTIDLSSFNKPPGDFMGPPLQEGDVVLVPRTKIFTVMVMGEVNKPGPVSRAATNVPPGQPIRVSHVILAAEGLKPSADAKAISVTRLGSDGILKSSRIDQSASGEKKDDQEQDPVLHDEDRVIVPAAEGILLAGKVRAPGIYPVPAGGSVKISRLIVMAGGFDMHAKKTAVTVIRKDKPGELVKVDVRAVIEDGHLDKDVLLFPGDIVFVSESVF